MHPAGRARGSRLDQIKVDGAARQLLFDDTGALWVTTDDGVVPYLINRGGLS